MGIAKYADPKADLIFKRVFGEHPDLVISLLNSLLPLPKDDEVVEIEYISPELTPENPFLKNSIVDVRCKDQKGRQFIVEMQMIWTPDFEQRALFNAAKTYSRQLPRGGDFCELRTVYSLNLVNENSDENLPGFYHHYCLVDPENKYKKLEGMEIVFVELKKFTPETMLERKMAVLWLRFLTEINEETRKAPPELTGNEKVNKALELVELCTLSEAELVGYDKFQMWLCGERRRANVEKKIAMYKEQIAMIPDLEAKIDAIARARNAAEARAEDAKARADAAARAQDAAEARAEDAEARAEDAEARAEVAEAARAEAEAKLQHDKLQLRRNLEALGLTPDQIARAMATQPECRVANES